MTLTELFTNIANAIRGKDGTTATIAPTDFASRISAIETGTQLPTLSNKAVEGEIASGKQAIDANGNVLTGTAYVNGISTYYMNAVDTTYDSSNDAITSWGQVSQNTFMYEKSVAAVKHSSSDFGDATAADVASGKTFTSSAGLKVTGNVETYDSGTGLVANAQSRAKSGNNLATMATNSSDVLLRSGSTIMINDPLTNFGDATAADVANGKTFTSSAGLKVTGTGSTSHYFIVHVADVDLGSASASITFTIDNVMIKDDIASGYACHGMAFLVYGDLLNGNYDITSAEVSYDGSDTWEAYTMNTAALLANMSKKATCSYNNSTGELTITSYRSDYKFVAGTWCLAMSFR